MSWDERTGRIAWHEQPTFAGAHLQSFLKGIFATSAVMGPPIFVLSLVVAFNLRPGPPGIDVAVQAVVSCCFLVFLVAGLAAPAFYVSLRLQARLMGAPKEWKLRPAFISGIVYTFSLALVPALGGRVFLGYLFLAPAFFALAAIWLGAPLSRRAGAGGVRVG